MTLRNIRLLLEYDGTNYEGWQAQKHDRPTIQGTITSAVSKLTKESNIHIMGASRTDSGVHAFGQVCSFKTESTVPSDKFKEALNTVLPDDIVVRESKEMPLEFNPKIDSKAKRYHYRILNTNYNSPIFGRHAWVVQDDLDISLMQMGASFFVGQKDFASFMAADSDAKTSVRELYSFTVEKKPYGFIEIDIRGSAFLRHMIRIMVGTLVELGKEKIRIEDIPKIIEACDRQKAPATAPSAGLFLKEVEY